MSDHAAVMPSTPAIPFPVVPQEPIRERVAEVPKNCVRRNPLPGGASVELVGYDGGGHPWTRVEIATAMGEAKIEAWERLIRRESEAMPALLQPSRSAMFPPGPRLVKP